MLRHGQIRLVFMAVLVWGSFVARDSSGQSVVLESATMGTPGRIGGTSISTGQFVGWRFETSAWLGVERIGGHLLSYPDVPGDIFAALVRLPSIDAVPAGAPFTDEEVVAVTTFRPSFPSDEAFAPLEATLAPGSYTLVFGTGMFGATGEGALHLGLEQTDIPPTDISSFIFWSIPFFGEPPEWRLNLASHLRFVIEAKVIMPGDFNRDGSVDAADYVVWRKTDGTPAGYDAWRANFGTAAGNGSGGEHELEFVAVPEPTVVILLLTGVALIYLARSR